MVVALAVAVAVDAAGASRALAAGTGREPLHGHQGIVPPGATLIGPAPSTTTLPLVVTLQPRDPAALSAEVQAVSDPRSPQYRHFLTPAEFARRFGATPSSVAQVASALRSQGLSVGTPSATGLSLPVSGTVAQVQSAFSTPISRYRLSSGKTGFDNGSAPEVPVAVAPQIEGILGLDTLSPPQPSTTVPQASSASPHPATSGAAPTVSGQPTPTCSGLSEAQTSYPGALDADQLAQAYSFDPLYAANHYGAGATVALLEMAGAGFSSSDISTFAACYGIPFTPGDGQITQKDVDGGGAEGPGTVESELDIEDVLSLAPQANIEVYEGEQSMYDVFSQIVSDHTAKIVSASWTNGCEAYVGQSYQNSENTLFQAAAIEGQSIFVASGDEGSEGCNVNGVSEAKTGTDPVAQAVDPSTGTLYIANKSSNTVSVDSEGSTSDPSNFANAFSVPTGSGPDAVALDSSAGEVFVANSGSSTLTEFSTTTCNQTTTSGCSSPTSILSGGNLNAPDSLVVNGSTLYVGNNNGKVAVYNITTNQFVATVTLASSSHPTALAVDAANGFVYVADGSNSRIEYFNATTCNATTFTTCSATPLTVPVGVDPVALAVASAGGDLYVGNAGTGGGITVVSLATLATPPAVVKTISTTQPSNVTGLVQSIGMSPNNQEVLAVLTGPSPSGSSPYFFPGDVMATVNTSTRSISATVSLQNGWDPMGQLVSDGTRDDVWALDESSGSDEGDLVQNLNLGVSDPASQPYVTAVGGTSVTSVGPPAPTETVWNDQLNYSEGAGGGGISQTFSMPAYQQPLGTVSGSSGTPCAASSGDCREVPDVSADADPSTGYFIYDSVNGLDWDVLGGTSGAAPLWAAVLAVDASADGNTAGYGALDPALYLLAQQSAGTYLNDVTTGNNDYNATDGGSYPAMAGYDMATGLGTPVASQLAIGLTGIPLDVVVSGTQAYEGTPSFTASANYAGSGSAPFGVTLNTSGLACTEVGTSTTITPTLPLGTDTLVASSCSGLTLSGVDAGDYAVVYTTDANDFTVNPGPVDVAVSGTQSFGGTPIFAGTDSPPPGITVSTTGLTCTKVGVLSLQPIAPTLAAGNYALSPSSCSGAALAGTNTGDYTLVYTGSPSDFTVTPALLTVTASSGSMNYGAAPPVITPGYFGFVNGNTPSSLTTPPTCSTAATSSSPVSGSPYLSSCAGAVDSNYSFSYLDGSVTVSPVPLTITASSPAMTYGGTVPAITAGYAGFVNGDTASSLSAKPTCSTTATGSDPVSPPTYPSSCSGAADPNYTIGYAGGSVTINQAPLTITASSASMTYGGTVAGIIPSYSGFVNGDGPGSLSTAPTCTTTATSSSPASPPAYTSSCSGASDANYTISYGTGSVTIRKAPLSVTASSGSMAYGGAVPAIAPSYSGFVNGDGPGSLSTAPTCTTTATSSSPVSGSPYLSSCAGAVDANYSFSYPTGSVTVGPVPLTITASSPTTPYGSAATIAPGYSGFVNGDTGSSLRTKPVCTTTATKSSPVSGSPYASSCSGAVDPNYVIAYVTGSVTVNPAPLTITASSGTMTYGSTPPAVTASYAGFANGDSAASLSPPPTCSTLAASTSPVSPPTYASSCNGAADPNYSFSYDEGAVTVNPAPIPVAVSGSQADMAAPSFSATDSPPAGVTVDTTGLTCSEVAPSTTITGNLPSGSYTLVASSCAGAQPTGNDAPDYEVVITSASGDFTVTGGPTQSNPSTPPPPTAPVTHGYWLVGSDGGIFTFGSASFYGSTGSLKLQRPVVGITPTKDRGGYWLVASDGGTFAFGDAGFYGSIPGLGLNPAGSGLPHSLNAPIVGMVPAADGQGYFVVASDGGVFAFGPGASFAGSCPGIGGCSGPAVAVIPDSSGSGYWLFTATGNVYTFGDAPYLGAPGGVGSPVTSAVRTPDGRGYWVLVANGTVYGFGDAVNYGSPGGQLGGLNPATAVFTTSDGGGYWVVSAAGAVDPYGDAPNDGGMAGTKLNGAIIAATGF